MRNQKLAKGEPQDLLIMKSNLTLHAAEPLPAFDASLLDPAIFAERVGSTAETLVHVAGETAKLGPRAVVW